MKIEIHITGTADNATAAMYREAADGSSREYLGNLTASLKQILIDLATIYVPAPAPVEAPAETPAAS